MIQGYKYLYKSSDEAEPAVIGTRLTVSCIVSDLSEPDAEQLNVAIDLKRTVITKDKKTFLKESGASSNDNHYGIIVLTKQLKVHNMQSTALKVISKYLNVYTRDEFVGKVFYC